VKRKKDITFSEEELCRNCGTPLAERYCSHCGQDRLMGLQRSFGRMVVDIGSDIFAFDDKSWSTVKKLLFRPGFLSKEYITGRLIRYTMPFKMFWMMVLIFTIVFSFHDSTSVVITPKDTTKQEQQQTETVENETAFADETVVKKDIADETVAKDAADETLVKEADTQKNVVSDFLQYLPYFMLLVIPIFTALLALFFRKEKYAFSEHLIFAVHLHTLIFFLFTLEILVSAYLFDSLLVFFLIICLYSMFAFFAFYNTRKKRNVFFRMLLIGLLYFIIVLVLLAGVLLILSLIFKLKGIYVG
jgi:hypothetical protein